MQRHPYLNTQVHTFLNCMPTVLYSWRRKVNIWSKEANEHDAGYHLSKRAWLKKGLLSFSFSNFVSRVLSFVPWISLFLDYEVDNDLKELFDDSKEIKIKKETSYIVLNVNRISSWTKIDIDWKYRSSFCITLPRNSTSSKLPPKLQRLGGRLLEMVP